MSPNAQETADMVTFTSPEWKTAFFCVVFLGCGIHFLEGDINNNDIKLLVQNRDPHLRP